MTSRRAFLRGLGIAGTSGLIRVPPATAAASPPPETKRIPPSRAAAQPPPETTKLRIAEIPSSCRSPEWMAGELLRAEGFADVQYVRKQGTQGVEEALASGEAQISGHFAAPVILRLEAGDPVVILAGEHVGCFELFGNERVRSIRDLKGSTVAIPALDPSPHAFIASMVAHVGLDPRKDITWVRSPAGESIRLFIEGKVDAYLGFPPDPQELRARKVGRVIVNSAVDRPWSQYFCCMLVGNRDFVRKHPVATKRAIRAILKSAEVCALEPEKTARALVGQGLAKSYDHALQAIKGLPYGRWREFDPEDTVRFYALRLHEAGMIKSTPQKILAQGTDWRFLTELRKELKG
jgi:NitT/TauT family transport system substrate-binding protein